MSHLSNKYNIPPEAVKQMIRDGVISCTWAKYEEVLEVYKNVTAAGVHFGDGVVLTVSERTNVPVSTVYKILRRK